jgi:hypothetical protein
MDGSIKGEQKTRIKNLHTSLPRYSSNMRTTKILSLMSLEGKTAQPSQTNDCQSKNAELDKNGQKILKRDEVPDYST